MVAKLRTRLRDELDQYFLEPSDLQWLAMIVDPVMLTTGLPILLMLGHGEIDGQALSIFKEKLMEEANFCSQQQHKAAMSGKGGNECGEVTAGDDNVLTLADDNDKEEDNWARVVRQTKAASAGTSGIERTAASTAADEANEAFTAWTSM